MKPACLLLMFCIGVAGSVGAPLEIRAADDAAAPLARKVRLPLTRLTLARLLTELERQTEVELTCDALMARRRLVLRADGRPLREVTDQVAHFTATPPGACTWEVRNAGRGRHLREDRRSKDAREILRQRRARDFDRRLQLAVAAAAMTPEQRVKLRAQAPRLAHRPPTGGVRLLQGLTEKQLQFVVRGGRLDLAYDDMSPALQEFVRARVSRYRYKVGIGDSPTPLYSFDGSREFRSTRLQVRLSGAPDRPGLCARLATGPQVGLTNPNILDPGVPPEEDQPGWLKKALAEQEAERRRRGLKPPVHPDKSLERRVTIRRLTPPPGGRQGGGEMRESRLSDCLEQLAAQIPLAVIAHDDPCFDDYYDQTISRGLKSDLVDLTVREALERIAKEFQVTWDMRGEWIRVWSERVLYAEMDGMNLTPRWETASSPQEEAGRAK